MSAQPQSRVPTTERTTFIDVPPTLCKYCRKDITNTKNPLVCDKCTEKFQTAGNKFFLPGAQPTLPYELRADRPAPAPETSKAQTDLERALRNRQCTRIVTSKKENGPMSQRVRGCLTCQLPRCCESCQYTCHAGHEFTEVSTVVCVCSCMDNEDNIAHQPRESTLTSRPNDNCIIFITFLPADSTVDDLKRVFSAYGVVKRTKLQQNGYNSSSGNQAMLEFADVDQARLARHGMNGRVFDGKCIVRVYSHYELTQNMEEEPFGTTDNYHAEMTPFTPDGTSPRTPKQTTRKSLGDQYAYVPSSGYGTRTSRPASARSTGRLSSASTRKSMTLSPSHFKVAHSSM
eukprot:gnl/Spiro4/1000_TR531_c0_g3_i1.p1 gnl/Spiro4/1000_TR531_c0_g3~~gnl/Spiro4/1000_TR531_c0_g3_i1.p1  ORF type:complete len:361 (-),score=33.10 gnl/Spiro4/1000_TR531_c0_g3_i1:72-1106(-)